MVELVRFFSAYAPLVYLVLAVGVLFAIRGLAQALSERKKAIFGLEREISFGRVRQAAAVLTVVLLLALGELILQAFVAPGLPAASMLATPTLDLLTVPTSTLPPFLASGSEVPAPTATAETSGCIPGQILITAPKPGETISGSIVIMGTADIPNFGFYKYEFAPAGSENWSTILAGRKVVRDGKIGDWDTSQLASGDYLLRLVVTDNQGNALPACVVPVRISGQ
ncbi:MAG: hypothetical protein FD146_405 [Anaerolineaceae bacterium]|nr:MAG: hypothetical protein FD146_405 [Anaerolineaceae bacterium]